MYFSSIVTGPLIFLKSEVGGYLAAPTYMFKEIPTMNSPPSISFGRGVFKMLLKGTFL